jgi:hypothetical protein
MKQNTDIIPEQEIGRLTYEIFFQDLQNAR